MYSEMKTLVFDKCVLLSINLQKFSVQRKADKSKMETLADKNMVTFGKKLLDSPELKAIEVLDRKIYSYLQWDKGMKSLPFTFKDGIYLIPLSLLLEVEHQLLVFLEMRNNLVTAFLKVYKKQIDEAKTRLVDQFRDKDYPSFNEVASRFGMYWEKFILSVPENIKAVSPLLYEEEKQRIASQMQDALKEILVLMRQEAATYIKRLIRKLTPKKDGSYPSLEQDSFEKIKSFLESFQARNICNDKELGIAVEMAKQALKGVKISDLENNDLLKEEIRVEFQKASSIFDSIDTNTSINTANPTINQIPDFPSVSENLIAQQIEDAMSVSEQVASQNMDWADNLFDFCEVAA